ncbi:MAG: hypothetical protein NC180_13145 [Muribaculaceae bacterium]|nr:hypothetical protein [Muribaculaceae bacterium]MCM1560174.1 hypothetical protein [Butyrivibrio sp.]
MKIRIKNCSNIDSGKFDIIEGCLNIKYAINGTGKSTISKAIDAFVNNDEDKKNALLPFKYYEREDKKLPAVALKLGKLQYLTRNILKTMYFNKQSC